MKNIVLIGMPGAGKSTIGIVLAKRVGFKFVDSDLVIQEKEGKLLHEIISEVGNDGFILPDGLRQYFVGIRERREALGGKKPFNFLQFGNQGLGVLKVCLAAAGHEGDFKKDDDGHKASKTVEKEQSVFEEVA